LKVELVLMRVILVVHNLVALPLSQRFTFSLSKYIAVRVPSLVTLLTAVVYAVLIVLYAILLHNPLQSWQKFPIICTFTSLLSCVTIVALQTALMEIYFDKVKIKLTY
jgi:hypothetical protein